MNKLKTILILGIWVAILPYLGFPYIIKNVLLSLSGLAILYLGYLLRRELKEANIQGAEDDVFDNFSENGEFVEKVEGEIEIVEK